MYILNGHFLLRCAPLHGKLRISVLGSPKWVSMRIPITISCSGMSPEGVPNGKASWGKPTRGILLNN